jgi:TPR repeat protein
MDPDDELSLIPVPERSLAILATGAERILSTMVGETLALVKDSTVEPIDLDALVREAKRIQRREGMTPEDIQAFKLFHQAATAGHPDGQYQVFECFRFGYGIPKDAEAELEWVRKSAGSGFARAQSHLGWCYHVGEGVARDDVEAIEWYRKAAEQGNACSQRNLGISLVFGHGVSADGAEAARWFRLAAEQGDACAQRWLGICYKKTDPCESLKWYRKAAEQGDDFAQFSLCVQLSTSDPREAVAWCRKAAEQGNYLAQRGLGVRLASGRGSPQDLCEAHAWIQLSIDTRAERHGTSLSGHVQQQANEIEASLSPAQREKAQELYQRFKRQYSVKR